MADETLSASRAEHMRLFVERVMTRLDAGRAAYGDKSFSKSPVALLDEILEEICDISGWGAVLAVRILEMKDALAAAEMAPQDDTLHGKLARMDTRNSRASAR